MTDNKTRVGERFDFNEDPPAFPFEDEADSARLMNAIYGSLQCVKSDLKKDYNLKKYLPIGTILVTAFLILSMECVCLYGYIDGLLASIISIAFLLLGWRVTEIAVKAFFISKKKLDMFMERCGCIKITEKMCEDLAAGRPIKLELGPDMEIYIQG